MSWQEKAVAAALSTYLNADPKARPWKRVEAMLRAALPLIEVTPAAAKRGSAMWIDTTQAPAHPERGGKYSDFELPAVECFRAIVDACAKEGR